MTDRFVSLCLSTNHHGCNQFSGWETSSNDSFQFKRERCIEIVKPELAENKVKRLEKLKNLKPSWNQNVKSQRLKPNKAKTRAKSPSPNIATMHMKAPSDLQTRRRPKSADSRSCNSVRNDTRIKIKIRTKKRKLRPLSAEDVVRVRMAVSADFSVIPPTSHRHQDYGGDRRTRRKKTPVEVRRHLKLPTVVCMAPIRDLDQN